MLDKKVASPIVEPLIFDGNSSMLYRCKYPKPIDPRMLMTTFNQHYLQEKIIPMTFTWKASKLKDKGSIKVDMTRIPPEIE